MIARNAMMAMSFPLNIQRQGKTDIVQLNPHDVVGHDNIIKLCALIANTVYNGGLLSLGPKFQRETPAVALEVSRFRANAVATGFDFGDRPPQKKKVVDRRRLDHDIAKVPTWDEIPTDGVGTRDTKWHPKQLRDFNLPVAMAPTNRLSHKGAIVPYKIKGLFARRFKCTFTGRWGRDQAVTDSSFPIAQECDGLEYVLLSDVAKRRRSDGEDERCMWVVWECPLKKCKSTFRSLC